MQDRDHCAGEIIKGVSRKGQAVVLVLAGEIDMDLFCHTSQQNPGYSAGQSARACCGHDGSGVYGLKWARDPG